MTNDESVKWYVFSDGETVHSRAGVHRIEPIIKDKFNIGKREFVVEVIASKVKARQYKVTLLFCTDDGEIEPVEVDLNEYFLAEHFPDNWAVPLKRSATPSSNVGLLESAVAKSVSINSCLFLEFDEQDLRISITPKYSSEGYRSQHTTPAKRFDKFVVP